MALEQTFHQFGQMVNLLVTNTQVVTATVLMEVILYGAIQFRGWWGSKT